MISVDSQDNREKCYLDLLTGRAEWVFSLRQPIRAGYKVGWYVVRAKEKAVD